MVSVREGREERGRGGERVCFKWKQCEKSAAAHFQSIGASW